MLTRRSAYPDPAAADDVEPRQRHPLRLRARPLPRRAGRGARCGVLPETSAEKLLVAARPRARRADRRPRTRASRESRCRRSSRGPTSSAGVTVLAEGTQGLLTSAAIDHFGIQGENPQIWALGVKEVWRVREPLEKIVHTLGWPLRTAAGYGEFGGSFIYPMGDELVSIGFVAGLEAKDVEFSVHDVLQEFKTHRLVWKILGGGERVAWGAKTITEGGYYSLPRQLQRARAAARGRGCGARQRAAAQGCPLRDRVGPAGGRGSVPRAPARRGAEPRRRARLLRRGAAREQVHERAPRGAEHAPGVRQGVLRRRRAREHDDRHEGAACRTAASRRIRTPPRR